MLQIEGNNVPMLFSSLAILFCIPEIIGIIIFDIIILSHFRVH